MAGGRTPAGSFEHAAMSATALAIPRPRIRASWPPGRWDAMTRYRARGSPRRGARGCAGCAWRRGRSYALRKVGIAAVLRGHHKVHTRVIRPSQGVGRRVRREAGDAVRVPVAVVVAVGAIADPHFVAVLEAGVVGPRQVDRLLVDPRGGKVGWPRWRRRAVRVRRRGVAQAVERDDAIAHPLLAHAPAIAERDVKRGAGRCPARSTVGGALDAEPILVCGVGWPGDADLSAGPRDGIRP